MPRKQRNPIFRPEETSRLIEILKETDAGIDQLFSDETVKETIGDVESDVDIGRIAMRVAAGLGDREVANEARKERAEKINRYLAENPDYITVADYYSGLWIEPEGSKYPCPPEWVNERIPKMLVDVARRELNSAKQTVNEIYQQQHEKPDVPLKTRSNVLLAQLMEGDFTVPVEEFQRMTLDKSYDETLKSVKKVIPLIVLEKYFRLEHNYFSRRGKYWRR